MNTNIFVKPAKDGLIVLKPNGMRLKPEGEMVADEPYWKRRIFDKEVIVQDQKPSANPVALTDKAISKKDK